MKERMEKWRSNVGVNFIERPSEDILEKALVCDGKYVQTLEPDVLDEMLLVLSNYYLFLKNSLGEVHGKIGVLSNIFDRELSIETAKKEGGHYEERKALAMVEKKRLQELSDKLVEFKFQSDILLHTCDGVKSKIEVFKRVYDRRVRK